MRRRRRRKGKGRKKERTTRLEAKRRGEGEGRTDDRGRQAVQSAAPPLIHPSVRPSVHPSIAFPWRKENRMSVVEVAAEVAGRLAEEQRQRDRWLQQHCTVGGRLQCRGPARRTTRGKEGRKEGRGRRVALTSSSLPSHALHPSSWVLALPCQAVSLPTSSLPSATSFR